MSVNIFVNLLGSKACHSSFLLSTKLKGHVSNYQVCWAHIAQVFRFQPHYIRNHKVVSMIEPDISCKLIRVRGWASKWPECHGKIGKVIFFSHQTSD